MSLQYWAQRLDGVYIKHKGEWRRIIQVEMDEEKWPPLREALGNKPQYPEDVEPAMLVVVPDKDGGYDRIPWTECSVEWPKEQYKIIKGKAVWMARTMQRQFVAGPTQSAYTCGRGGTATFMEWLSADAVPFSKSAGIMAWEKGDSLIDDLTSVHWVNGNLKVMHCNTLCYTIRRTKEFTHIEPAIEGIPAYLKEQFNRYLGNTGYLGPAFRKVKDDELVLNYKWTEVPNGEIFDHYSYSVSPDGYLNVKATGRMFQMLSYEHLVYYIKDADAQADIRKIAIKMELKGPYRLINIDEDEDNEENW